MAYASLPTQDPIAVADLSEVPLNDPRQALAKRLPKLRLGEKYIRWLSGLRQEVDTRPKRHVHARVATSSASIATTPLDIPTVYEGVWLICLQVRVTTPGSVSGEILVTISWTQNGVGQSESTANLTGNLTSTREGRIVVVRADGATPISYATTYLDGGGATPMAYELDIVAMEAALDS